MSTPIQSSSRLESCTDRDFRHKRSWNRKGRFLLLLHAKNKNTRTLQKKTHQDVAILFNICCGIWSRRGHDIKELTKSHILPMECCSKQRNMTKNITMTCYASEHNFFFNFALRTAVCGFFLRTSACECPKMTLIYAKVSSCPNFRLFCSNNECPAYRLFYSN